MVSLAAPKPRKNQSGRSRAAFKTARSRARWPHAASGASITKTADHKGRVLLGGRFANRVVLIEPLSPTEVVVKMARVIPEREAWLYENPGALATVRSGLAQARKGAKAKGPDLAADAKLAAELEG